MDRISLRLNDEVVKVIQARGLSLWFQEVKGYNFRLCKEFYRKLTVFGEDGCRLRTNVQGRPSR